MGNIPSISTKSDHINMLLEFNNITPDFKSVIEKINNFNDQQFTLPLPGVIIRNQKDIFINKIKLLENKWNKEWSIYNSLFFSNNSIDIINKLISSKKIICYEMKTKCSTIYDDFLYSINVRPIIDLKVYK
jgi:hypothetical protein